MQLKIFSLLDFKLSEKNFSKTMIINYVIPATNFYYLKSFLTAYSLHYSKRTSYDNSPCVYHKLIILNLKKIQNTTWQKVHKATISQKKH